MVLCAAAGTGDVGAGDLYGDQRGGSAGGGRLGDDCGGRLRHPPVAK